jgi:hypothetical protein
MPGLDVEPHNLMICSQLGSSQPALSGDGRHQGVGKRGNSATDPRVRRTGAVGAHNEVRKPADREQTAAIRVPMREKVANVGAKVRTSPSSKIDGPGRLGVGEEEGRENGQGSAQAIDARRLWRVGRRL